MTGVRDLGLPQGNPLALPRREAATGGAVSSGKYDLVFRGSANRPSTPNAPTSATQIVLMNGRGCFFQRQSTTNYRTTFDYSSAGITNLTTVSGNSSTLPITLPDCGGIFGTLTDRGRYIWSHPVSPTQTLFHYANSSNPDGGLFLVTWDGTGSPTTTTPTLPSGFVKNRAGSAKYGSDAFIMEDGNIGILANNSTTGMVSLHVYTPTFTFVRTLNISNVGPSLAAAMAVKIRKTSYGYIVAMYTVVVSGSAITGLIATLNKDCTAVISTTSSSMTGVTSQNSYTAGVVLGEEGAIITGVMGNNGIVGSLVFPVSSSGIVTNSAASGSSTNNPFFTANTANHFLLDAIFQGSCCSKYADRNSSYAFLVSAASSGNIGGGYSYSPNSSQTRAEYSDMIVTPFIHRYGDPASATRRTAQIETDVKSVQSVTDSVGYVPDVSAEDPEGGFVLLSSNQPGYPMYLFEKEYR